MKKSPGMQTYMIDKNEELQPEPQEKIMKIRL